MGGVRWQRVEENQETQKGVEWCKEDTKRDLLVQQANVTSTTKPARFLKERTNEP